MRLTVVNFQMLSSHTKLYYDGSSLFHIVKSGTHLIPLLLIGHFVFWRIPSTTSLSFLLVLVVN